MRICDMNTGAGLLTKAAKRLREQWESTRPFWHDQNAVDLEKDLLQPLAPQLTLTLARIHRMAQLLEQAERDCLDEEETT
jgi:hypothetical protein